MLKTITAAITFVLLCVATAIGQQKSNSTQSPDKWLATEQHVAVKLAMQKLYDVDRNLSELSHLPHGSPYYLDYYSDFAFFGPKGAPHFVQVAAEIVFWSNDLLKLGYQNSDIAPLMKEYERAATTERQEETGSGTIVGDTVVPLETVVEGDPQAEPRLAEGLNRLRRNTARPQIIAGRTPPFAPQPAEHLEVPSVPPQKVSRNGQRSRKHDTGNALVDALNTGIPVFIHTEPKAADVQIIPSGFFYLCGSMQRDPYSAQCDHWVSVQEAGNLLAGRYLYKVHWSDGVVSCGILTFLSDLERAKPITLREPPQQQAESSCPSGTI